MREQQECMELCLGTGDESAEGCLVKIRGQTNVGEVVVEVCYRLPDQDVDETYFKQLEEASFASPGPGGGHESLKSAGRANMQRTSNL